MNGGFVRVLEAKNKNKCYQILSGIIVIDLGASRSAKTPAKCQCHFEHIDEPQLTPYRYDLINQNHRRVQYK